MAARGTESKATVFNTLMKSFPKAFWEDENKILRIPLTENGNPIEIKVTLTAAKNNLAGVEAASAFTLTQEKEETMSEKLKTLKASPASNVEMTQEEKDNVAKLMASLGL